MNALTYVPSLRGDALLLTHGREGTERLIGAALLLDGILGGQLDVGPLAPERRRDGYEAFVVRMDRRRVIAGPERADDPLVAELRARVIAGPPDTPRSWIERCAGFAPSRVAVELVSAGIASPHERRFQRGVSVDARAEAGARNRLELNPALAAACFAVGFAVPMLAPITSFLTPAAVAVIAALR